MNISRLKIDQIITDAGTQARAAIDEAVVAAYAERMEEGDRFPLVIVFSDGSMHYLGDGFHRTLAAQRCGFVDIDAEVRKGTREDALWFALGANRTNGQRMNRGDVRHAVEVALRTWPDKTQQAISDQVGCSQGTVAKVKADIIPGNIIPETRTDSMGRTRPTTYRKTDKPTDPDEMPTVDPLKTMKSAWRVAPKADREQFLQWVDRERAQDLPVDDQAEAYRLTERLAQVLRRCRYPGPLNMALSELKKIKEGREAQS